jgi:L-Lysine epsilon oxidase N-terminal/L-lysine epsilon oxidase C-terminal domain
MPKPITRVAVYPPIGIARVGNSPEHYLAPEVPGHAAVSPGGYKDRRGRVKKQVVRFRVYGLDDDGHAVKELTADDAEIQWRVHVANRKAAWYQFNNALDLEELAVPAAFRNGSASDRSQLLIDPGPRAISGRGTSGPEYHFTGGEFFGKQVPLGQIRTDGDGRLLFFGGDGHSASRDGAPAVTFANNDGWHDDVSDGPVRATVTYQGRTFEASPAMAAVTPPNFGQGLFGAVTLHDVVLDLFIKSGWVEAPKTVNFWSHVYPILRHMSGTQWVNSGFFMLFGKNSPSDFTDPAYLETLADPSESAKPARRRLFEWFRDPASDAARPAKIPPFYGDAFGEYVGLSNDELAVTASQYGWLERWAAGDFSNDKPAAPRRFDDMTPQQQTESLTVTPLEECLGGPFHPGIELTWPMRNLIMWHEPFRLKVLPEGVEPRDDFGPLLAPKIALAAGGPLDGSGPGTLTRWLGVPWQTDEASCLSGYNPSTYLPLPSFWAARVPNQVLSEDSFKRLTDPSLNIAQRLKHFDYRQDWLRDLGSAYQTRINNMVKEWWQLGIVAPQAAPADDEQPFLPDRLWVESDRGPFIEDDPSYSQVLRAENADRGHLEKAERMLTEAAGKELAARKPRKRRVFGRGER